MIIVTNVGMIMIVNLVNVSKLEVSELINKFVLPKKEFMMDINVGKTIIVNVNQIDVVVAVIMLDVEHLYPIREKNVGMLLIV